MAELINFPPQSIPYSMKTKKWRKKCLDWAEGKTFFNYSLVRKSVIHKKINYDLLLGKLHMSDLELILNPEDLKAGFIPDKITHYPIINSKLNILRGEEAARVFDYKVIVTNPNAISEIENTKKEEILQRLTEIITNTAQSEEEYNQEVQKLSDYYTYEWQDLREIRANALLQHYIKEYNMPLLFNKGFMDALTVGEEMYLCDIVGGEPTIERLNPLKVRIFKSGYESEIEKADIIIIEDYWSPSKIIDTFYDVLSPKDIKYIEELPDNIGHSASDSMDNIDERLGFINKTFIDETTSEEFYFDPMNIFTDSVNNTLMPYDVAGNIRVIRLFWKSKRRIKKIKSYDPQTGEEIYNFYPETYIPNKDLGEEEQIFYVNQAWEGTKIGKDIYVNMRPRPIQYNRLSDPSRCHFGIIGSIYNLNDSRPYSFVDMMKQYNYYYDVIHDRLNKLIARNWGKIITLDIAKVPKGWDVNKWMYYAKINGIAVVDSFNEGQYGASLGKIAGGLNNASSGVIDAELGNTIQSQIALLEFIKSEMSEAVGITRQREGQISNRETVGGVERATLQSSHITEWIFFQHEDVKRRVLECFLETAKIALKGRSAKFQYLLSDSSMQIMNIDGDEFAECDYGLLIDNGKGTQELSQKLDMLAQAALQNQTLSFSTIMKLYNSCSIAEKQKLVEKDEKAIQERNAQAQQEQLQAQQEMAQIEMQQKQSELKQREDANVRDNETRIIVAEIAASNRNNEQQIIEKDTYSQESKDKLAEQIREFDAKLKLDKEKLELDKSKARTNAELKRQQIHKKINN